MAMLQKKSERSLMYAEKEYVQNRTIRISVQKRSFSGPYFSVFGLNTEILRI